MNGKMAKLLRKLNRETGASKRNFNSLTATEKGKLREIVSVMESSLSQVWLNEKDVLTETTGENV